jgi:predicted MPP superfamily phosphohydrolase
MVETPPMLILHISDIHFRAPDCVNPNLDPDRPYRTRIIQDARASAAILGPVGAILVGGTIAFKGDPQEYAAAFAWLEELAEACGCPIERVFVIPGNHDVDRGLIARTPSTRNAQQAIQQAAPHRRERELRTRIHRSPVLLLWRLRPAGGYNTMVWYDFAAPAREANTIKHLV